ncbi:MAG TPA: peptidylprolyl isomerase [Thermotogota bacterium]|nr:peptidylprolyl isomerase [Thermotogota bacterium]HPJ88703.1 peptidylprolyl isomerase [Thermotogota bacterium]HPR95948.1 peptidylprolyl isomerase [Thermotogota bacterium]
MRDFIMKWRVTIIWVIAIVFVVGIGWLAVSPYMNLSTSQQQTEQQEYVPNSSEALAVITKDSTELNYAYWLMPNEVTERVQQIEEYYSYYGKNLDELFEMPFVELNAAKAMIDDKIAEYYADTNSLSPTEDEVDKEVEAHITQNITTDAIRQAVIQRYGSVENYKSYIKPEINKQLKKTNVKNNVATVTEADLEKYFDENKETIMKNGNQVKAAHILVDDQELANDILAQINNGELTFSEAAVKYSTDKSNAETGGELDWFGEGTMVDEFYEAALAGEVGTVVGPVKTQYGYHLIDIQDKKVLNSYDDFKNNSELLTTAEDAIKDDKYDVWLESYKKDNEFAYILNDDVLNVYDRYLTETNNGEELTTVILDNFTKWLEEYIVVEGEDGSRKIDTEVDPRTVALYVTVMENINDNLSTQKRTLNSFLEISSEVADEYKVKSEEDLNAEVEKISAELNQWNTDSLNINNNISETETLISEAATGTDISAENEKLNTLKESLIEVNEKIDAAKNEQQQLKNAVNYVKLVSQLKEENIYTDDVESVISDIDKTLATNEETILNGLTLLYNSNTSSTQVISQLYKYDPENTEVKLKWLEMQVEQYTLYLNDNEIFTQYRAYLEPQLLQLQLGLLDIAQDSEEPESRRISAYEDVLNLLEKWGKYEEEITYLEELKALKSDYPDIDQIIDQVKEQVELLKTATETSINSTSTVE